jgi:GNAT superfamily N-acetyltransferase
MPSVEKMHINDVQLRPAHENDASELIVIQTAALLENAVPYYSAKNIELWTAGLDMQGYIEAIANAEVVVAYTRANLLVGFGHYKREWQEIKELYVRPSHSRMGIGRKLAAHMEQAARADNVKIFRTFSSLNAVDFYTALGFTVVERKELEVAKSIFLPFFQMEKALN